MSKAALSGKYAAYPEYKDSGVEWLGEMPSHWSMTKMAWNFKAEKGKNGQLLTKDYCGLNLGPFAVYSGQTENDGVMGRINSFEFDTGNDGVLFATTVGAKAMHLSHLTGKFSLSQNCMIIAPKSDSYHVRFSFYHFQPLFYYERGLIPEHMQASFRMEDLYQYQTALPTVEEQQKIANFLDHETAKIDTLIEKQQQLIKLLKEKRQAVISHAVTKGLPSATGSKAPMRDSGVEWLGEVPEHWEVQRLKFACSFITKKIDIGSSKTIALENIESWTGKYISTDAKYSGEDVGFETGDILFGKLRPYLAKVYLAAGQGVAFGDLLTYRPKNKLLSTYCFYQLINEAFINTVDSSTYGSKMPRASADFINNMSILLPPLEEQEEIAAYILNTLNKFDNVENKAKSAIKLMQERRTALISAAVTGKIDVRNWKAV
ncbi:MAG: type I restriction enzyme S subunit [Candidatus Endobugula sp.]|jgi:type I restriction enzyme S subunit